MHWIQGGLIAALTTDEQPVRPLRRSKGPLSRPVGPLGHLKKPSVPKMGFRNLKEVKS